MDLEARPSANSDPRQDQDPARDEPCIEQAGKGSSAPSLQLGASRIAKRFKKLAASVLHDDETDFERSRRNRLGLFLRLSIPALIYFTFEDIRAHSYGTATVVAIAAFLQIITAVKLDRGSDRKQCNRWYLFSLCLIMSTSHLWDGQAFSMSLWLVSVLPMCAAFLEDTRSAFRYLLVATGIVLAAMFSSLVVETTQWIDNAPSHCLALRLGAMAFFGVPGLVSHSVSRNQIRLLSAQEQELSRIKKGLEAASTSKASFFANVSHEIRTPMNGVLGMTQTLLASNLTQRTRESVEVMHQCAQDLLKLLTQILDLSTLQISERDRSTTKNNLQDLFHASEQALRSSEPAKTPVFTLDAPASPIEIQADAAVLHQLIGALLDFAAQETRSQSVEVALRPGPSTSQNTSAQLFISYPSRSAWQSPEQALESQAHHLGELRSASVSLSIAEQLASMMGATLEINPSEEGAREQLALHFASEPSSPLSQEALPGSSLQERFSQWFRKSESTETSGLLTLMQALAAPGAIAFLVDALIKGYQIGSTVLGAGLTLLLLSRLVNRCTERARLASWIFIASTSVVAGSLNLCDGQIWSESLWLLPALPIAALFLLGNRAFALVFLACIAILLSVFWASSHYPLKSEYPDTFTYILLARLLFLQIFGGLSIIAAYASSRFSKNYAARRIEMHSALKDYERAHSEKSKFLTNMSHAIRTPMNGILGIAESLLDKELPPEQQDAMRTIHRCGGHLLSLLGDVFDLSTVKGKQESVTKIPMDLNQILHDVVHLFQAKAAMKSISLEYLGQDQELLVMGDPTRLMQVLSNLVGNALKFSDHGQVALALVRCSPLKQGGSSGYDLVIEVRDQGIGIAESRLEDLFTSFVQVSDSQEPDRGGTGLGLAISQRLIRAMGGKLDVESERGHGSTFRIQLWLAAAKELDLAKSDILARTQDPAPSQTRSEDSPLRRILVVDDNVINLKVAVACLHRFGFETQTATNGQDAIELCETTRYDAVLMDIRMPGIDGLEATRRIRSGNGASKHAPILALTADSYEEQKRLCLEAGMNDHLAKPFRAAKLEQSLNALWNKAPNQQDVA